MASVLSLSKDAFPACFDRLSMPYRPGLTQNFSDFT
jgi:hypothetical protein